MHNTRSTYVSLCPTGVVQDHGGKTATGHGRGGPHPPSASQWDALYPVLYQLYVTERRKLSEVMAIVERHHDFKAT
jgi:hypothetical protein